MIDLLSTEFLDKAEWHSHGGSTLVMPETYKKMQELDKEGYTIVIGNNPNMDKWKKNRGKDLVRLSRVNRWGGFSVRTIWAVKEER